MQARDGTKIDNLRMLRTDRLDASATFVPIVAGCLPESSSCAWTEMLAICRVPVGNIMQKIVKSSSVFAVE